ncbi:MAG: hypothetical protein MK160_13300 [Rhodobacteraceae bacterium]|nr:hypothetical protein [Paracoccaceae bacterium]
MANTQACATVACIRGPDLPRLAKVRVIAVGVCPALQRPPLAALCAGDYAIAGLAPPYGPGLGYRGFISAFQTARRSGMPAHRKAALALAASAN